ncbi:isopenicillin N synthase family dioxygenase [Nocardia terpenica]|uniref:Isopenicillin N synthase family oxygenase n=1 Tax=Nocardia terpenica TaxID=455432 RepID=A0A6G9Z7I0_9NOCA|nr:isopenicillin N synthase family oxygenase [Nocardia terpenica]QIS21565.1 isopenicillin N synthase family oxygenase [Nocardia terpenica]
MDGAGSFASVPVIDVAGLFSGDPVRRKAIAHEIGRAAGDVGFFYIGGTGFDFRRYDDLLAVARRFFALPYAEKMRSYIGFSRCHRGYVPQGEEGVFKGRADLKEVFDSALDLPADDPDYLAGNPMLGPNVWPAIPGFAQKVTAYYDAVLGIGRKLLGAFAVALGEEPDRFLRHARKPPSQLRLNHYRHDPAAGGGWGSGEHTDYECFTLLTATGPGLEILGGDGNWIDVPPVPGTFVVNIGDLMELWTNGEFVATTHRVRRVPGERYSFPLFFCVDYDTVIRPLPRFHRPGRPIRRPLRAGEHVFAQTAQTFRYLRNRMALGDLRLPEGALSVGSFGYDAVPAH